MAYRRSISPAPTTSARAVAIQSDGRIVAVGSGDPNKNFTVARFNPDGSDDASFSDDGKAVVTFGEADHATAVAIQPDGRIVVAGYTDAGGDNDFAVARLNPDGTLDSTFSGDGKQTIDFGSDDRAAGVVHRRHEHRRGRVDGGGDANFAIARLTADGTLDGTFSTDGKQFGHVRGRGLRHLRRHPGRQVRRRRAHGRQRQRRVRRGSA